MPAADAEIKLNAERLLRVRLRAEATGRPGVLKLFDYWVVHWPDGVFAVRRTARECWIAVNNPH